MEQCRLVSVVGPAGLIKLTVFVRIPPSRLDRLTLRGGKVRVWYGCAVDPLSLPRGRAAEERGLGFIVEWTYPPPE